MRRKLLFIFALLSTHLSLVTSECPPGARGLNREGKLVCVELSEVNLRIPVNHSLSFIAYLFNAGPPFLVSSKEKMYWKRPETAGATQ